MKKFTLIIIIIMSFGLSMACNNPIFKFITVNNDTVIICKSDITKIDTIKSILILTEDAALKIKDVESSISEVFYYNVDEEWEEIYMTSVFSAARYPPYKYLLTNKGSLFLYLDPILVYEGLFSKPVLNNDTTIVNLVFRLCDNQKDIAFPLFDKANLTYSFRQNQGYDTLICAIAPIVKEISDGGATMEYGTKIRLTKKNEEYIQPLFIPLSWGNMIVVRFIVVTYKDSEYVFYKNFLKKDVFEMFSAKDLEKLEKKKQQLMRHRIKKRF